VAGDMLFSHNFDIGQVINYFKLKVSWWRVTEAAHRHIGRV